MKKTNLNLRKLPGTISAILICVSFLFLTGCQKDEMPTVSNSSDNSSQSSVERKTSDAYTMIIIDHSPARTNLPSYRVQLRTDGTGWFEGRKNTAIIGTKKFYVSPEGVADLRKLFDDNKFGSIENLPLIYDLPTVETTYRPGFEYEPIVRLDYNNIKPTQLIMIRNEAEKMMGIAKFVVIKQSTNSLKVNMEQQD